MKLIITRPADDSIVLAQRLRELGHDVVTAPRLEIVANPVIKIPEKRFVAMLVTSANGVKCLPGNSVSLDVRVIAIGAQSAKAARDCGFQNVEAHGGDVIQLGQWIVENLSPDVGPLLYVTGKEISGDLAGVLSGHGFEIHRVETYRAEALPLKLSQDEIASCDGVLLYSSRSAKLWVSALDSQRFLGEAAHLRHYCLSSAVAEVLPQDWLKSVASEPTESALLHLLEPADKGE